MTGDAENTGDTKSTGDTEMTGHAGTSGRTGASGGRRRERALHVAGYAVTLAVLVTVVVVAAMPGRPSGKDSGTESILDKDSLVIGVKPDQPRVGWRNGDGTFEGFDVDVALYVAGILGVRRSRVTFRAVLSSDRERVLRDGTVDMVFATYSITPERRRQVTFGGPYYVAHQDILVRAGDREIRNVRDLAGRRLCQAAGSNSWRRVTEERRVDAELVPFPSYSRCVTGLLDGSIDAVSTDDLILAGYAAADAGSLRMVNAPFTNERYGVGLPKGDLRGCERVNEIITRMYQSGAAETLLGEWFGPVLTDLTTTVPEFVGCA
jgi:glutamate transport system substrate-binding protein